MTYEEISERLKNYRFEEEQRDDEKKRTKLVMKENDETRFCIFIQGKGASSFHEITIERLRIHDTVQDLVRAPLETIKSFGVGYDALYLTLYCGVQLEIPVKLEPIRG